MKHGPIALIDENMPVVFLAQTLSAYEKIVSNIQEVKARKGRIIAVVNRAMTDALADHVIEVPETEEILIPARNHSTIAAAGLPYRHNSWL